MSDELKDFKNPHILQALKNKVTEGTNPEFSGASLISPQSSEERQALYNNAQLSLLEGEEVTTSLEQNGFFMMPIGTTVMVEIVFDATKNKLGYTLGELELTDEPVEVNLNGYLPTRENDNTEMVKFGLNSPEKRKQRKEMDDINRELNRLNAYEHAPQDSIGEVEEIVEKLQKEGISHQDSYETEETRLAQTFIISHPQVISLLKGKQIPSENVTSIELVARTTKK